MCLRGFQYEIVVDDHLMLTRASIKFCIHLPHEQVLTTSVRLRIENGKPVGFQFE